MWPFRKKERATAAPSSDSVEQYMNRLQIQRLMTEDFSLTIENIYTIMGLGLRGLQKDQLHVGDRVVIRNANQYAMSTSFREE